MMHDYQVKLVGTLLTDQHPLCIAPMGSGKTFATLAAFDKSDLNTMVVFAPLRVAQTVWSTEAAKWFPYLRVSVCVGTEAQRRRAMQAPADIFVFNYETATWLLVELKNRSFGKDVMVVFDELTRLKNPSSVRGKAIRKLTQGAGKRVGLTGTPRPTGDMDLFAQVTAVKGPVWGTSFPQWRARHFYKPNPFGYEWAPRPGSTIGAEFAALSHAVTPPPTTPPHVIEHHVKLPAEAQRAHDTALREAILEHGSVEEVLAHAAVGTMKARQIVAGSVLDENGVSHVTHNEKLDVLADIVTDTEENLLVVYGFRAEVAALKAKWPDVREMGSGDAAATVEAWNRGDIKMLAVHPMSAGHGLNLQAGGRRIVFLTCPWSAEERQQTIARLARQGQTQPVYVHDIIADQTVDEAVYARLRGREAAQDALIKLIKDNVT